MQIVYKISQLINTKKTFIQNPHSSRRQKLVTFRKQFWDEQICNTKVTAAIQHDGLNVIDVPEPLIENKK